MWWKHSCWSITTWGWALLCNSMTAVGRWAQQLLLSMSCSISLQHASLIVVPSHRMLAHICSYLSQDLMCFQSALWHLLFGCQRQIDVPPLMALKLICQLAHLTISQSTCPNSYPCAISQVVLEHILHKLCSSKVCDGWLHWQDYD
jgi:hypothetical protein